METGGYTENLGSADFCQTEITKRETSVLQNSEFVLDTVEWRGRVDTDN